MKNTVHPDDEMPQKAKAVELEMSRRRCKEKALKSDSKRGTETTSTVLRLQQPVSLDW